MPLVKGTHPYADFAGRKVDALVIGAYGSVRVSGQCEIMGPETLRIGGAKVATWTLLTLSLAAHVHSAFELPDLWGAA